MSGVSIFMGRRQVQIQTTSEMTPYFTMAKCNKLFILAQLKCLPTAPSSISTISMTVDYVFNTRV